MRKQVDILCVLSLFGAILKWLSVPLGVPFIYSLFGRENPLVFLIPVAVSLIVGFLLERLDTNPKLGLRETFLLVSLSWLGVTLVGGLPYLLAGEGTVAIPINAFFESMSGFTTTGATVMGSISFVTHSPEIMLWRQITQWLGGMGIIVLGIAILPRLSIGGSELIEAEAPGTQFDRITPRIVETARILWLLYVVLTITLGGLLYGSHLIGLSPEMDLYNAVAHALTTMPTGGFSPEAESIAAFSSTVQWIIIPFMFIAGVNYALTWRAFTGNPRKLYRDTEFLFYSFILLFTTAIILAMTFGNTFEEPQNAIRHSLFQVLTFVTTAGYASHDFNTWNSMAQTVLFMMMFIGGCAGSTGGGIKVFRWIVTIKTFFKQLFTTIYPRAVQSIRVGKNVIKNETARRVTIMILLYIFTFLIGALIIEIESYRIGLELETLEIMSASAACIGNIGPGFGIVGPMNNYLAFSSLSKVVMIFLMWAGRLELFTLFVIFIPKYWRN
ncbi:potassium transporter TrkH [Aliifodinibius salipaludis]|uniref:Potassium transporter TrkH n=1 Tax=Fodinibius salipaludis TaxID=2032627 RepID=A0A2A2GCH2_9BACT|nr:TrkH family potassium uptake protein [Aliifodinibius salipaludis]PAU95356.1 potassium transporter TrkH [Aliifodinibius salipaludis]